MGMKTCKAKKSAKFALIFMLAVGWIFRVLKRRAFRENHQFRPVPLTGWIMCLKFRTGLLCAKWLVIGILLTVALHGNLWAQSFRAAASASVTTGVTSFTVNKPTGTQENDVMIAAIAIRPYSASITAPTGWTLVRRTDNSSTNTLAQIFYRKVAGSSEGTSYTWTLGSSPTGAAGGIMTFYGINTTTPVNVENGQATPNSTSHSTPDVTTTVNNTMVVTAHSFTSSYYWTPPTGMTEAVDIANLTPPNQLGISIEMNYVAQPSAGATGVKTATAPGGDPDAGVAQILALTPAPNLTQAHYRWRNDDGPEGGSSSTILTDGTLQTYNTFTTSKVSSYTFSYSVSASANNRLMILAVSLWPSALGYSVSNVKWNTTENFTNLDVSNYSTEIQTELWYLKNPTAGNYSVVVTFTGSVNCSIGVIAFKNVDQTNTFGTVGKSNSGGYVAGNATLTVSSASGELVFATAAARNNSLGTFSGDTQLWNLTTASYAKGSAGTTAGASSVSVNWPLSGTNYWGTLGVSMRPQPATFVLAEDSMLGVVKLATWRLRFLVSNAGGGSTGALQYQLQVAETATCSSGTYYAVGGSGDGADWAMAASANFADGDATANIASGLTDPGGSTFVAGQLKETTNQTGNITLEASQFTEIEYSIQAAAGATASGYYCFRLYDATGGSALNSYTYAQAQVLGATAIGLLSFDATYPGEALRGNESTGQGVLLHWRTGYEVDNLGFHIYREEDGERYRVTPELIAGSAFLVGTGTPLTAGRSYTWIDASALTTPSPTLPPGGGGTGWGGLSAVRYYLEDWDLNGKRTMHGPVTPVRSDKPLLKYGNATLLSNLGKRQNEKYDEFWRIQEIRERLQRTATLEDRPAERGSKSGPPGLEGQLIASPPPSPSPLEGEGRGGGVRSAPQVTPEAERSSIAIALTHPTQLSLASQAGVKIGIREQGWYRVTQPELVAAGLDPWGDPRRLRLFADGQEQAILVSGQGDGRFDPGDSIEFYGTGQDTPFTNTRVYWLMEGEQLGKRIKTRQSIAGLEGSLSFPHTVQIKERSIYIATLKNGDTENFFGAVVKTEGADQILNVTNLDPSAPGNALLEVALQGVTNAAHRVMVFVNDAEVMEMRFDGVVRKVMKVAIPQSWLLEGENLVSLVAQGGEADISVLDSIQLMYWHTYTAEEDVLLFSLSAGRQVAIGGFTSSSIRVADITNPGQVQEVTGGVVEPEGLGYRVRLGVPGSGKRTLLTFTEAAIKSTREHHI